MNIKKTYSSNRFSISNYFKKFSLIRWIFFVAFFFFLISFGLLINKIVTSLQINAYFDTPWTVIDKFTWQSNMLLLIFTFFFVFLPKHQFLRTDTFLISTLSYIFFTFVGYNLILTFVNGGYPTNPYECFVSIWTHLICPLIFIACGITKFIVYSKYTKLRSFWKTLFFGMLYPTIYVIYLSTVPFIFNTNSNEAYTLYGKVTDTKNNPQLSWPVIAAMYFAFFPGTFAGFYFLAKKLKTRISKRRI